MNGVDNCLIWDNIVSGNYSTIFNNIQPNLQPNPEFYVVRIVILFRMTSKRTVIVLALLFFSASAIAQSAQSVVIENPGKKKGKLYIGWYNKAGDFRKPDKAVFEKIVTVAGSETVSVSFENVSPGTYAIALFLDENDNGKIDTNFLGIPREKYGFSNNIYPLMRPATFKESSFLVNGTEKTITIRLK